jgi:hypothetical protein
MPLLRRLAVPAFGHFHVERQATPKLVGLCQIKLGDRVAGNRERSPFLYGVLIVATVPQIEPGLWVSQGG